MSAAAGRPRTLGRSWLGRLPAALRGPAYDRGALAAGMAHIGVGAFHRCHQAEYTDDLLEQHFGRWGVVGINLRPPRLADSLGRQDGLYTRLLREDGRVEARVIGSILSAVDAETDVDAALAVLASSDIEVVTMTVTEKGYCHKPATGALIEDHPDIVHDLAHAAAPRSLPGLLVRALEMRKASHGRPLTLISCDNIPANGVILGNVVRSLAARRDDTLADWIEASASFPSSMVDRIVPATTPADRDAVEQRFGYRDDGVVVGEPFRQWVIEDRFAGRVPRWDSVGASFVDDVTPYEHMKMRLLNGAQSTLCYLGLFTGHEHTFEAVADPLLAGFVRRMLIEESLPTLHPVPGVSFVDYVEQSLGRLRNTAIRHRNHQIATDGSQKIVQRLLAPALQRLRRGERLTLLPVAVAGWMAYLVSASARFGRRWPVEDPYAERIAGIADRVGHDATALTAEILAIDTIFDPALAAHPTFRTGVADGLAGLLSTSPRVYLDNICRQAATIG